MKFNTNNLQDINPKNNNTNNHLINQNDPIVSRIIEVHNNVIRDFHAQIRDIMDEAEFNYQNIVINTILQEAENNPALLQKYNLEQRIKTHLLQDLDDAAQNIDRPSLATFFRPWWLNNHIYPVLPAEHGEQDAPPAPAAPAAPAAGGTRRKRRHHKTKRTKHRK
jgi:hypothetical protein